MSTPIVLETIMRDIRDVRYTTASNTSRRLPSAEDSGRAGPPSPMGAPNDDGNRSLADDIGTMEVYTVEETAAVLRVSSKTVRRRIKAGEIRLLPIGGRLVRISAAELRRILSGGDAQAADAESMGYEVLGRGV
ncbi:MAG: helix-turn-helix domain-containing protein [Desulfobacterales bacterium]|nr:helix-turn-helix domain-containing protein [Desulfobacterales bacterium]